MPIKNFEDITHNLNDAELKLIPLFIAGFEDKIGKDNAITNNQIVNGFRARYNIKLGSARIRTVRLALGLE